MSHHLDYITDQALSALIVADIAKSSPIVREARITKLGGFAGHNGVRIKTRRIFRGEVTDHTIVDLRGEDLYALREFLAELPESAFVRPADPVVVPDRWTDGDIVEEFHGVAKYLRRIWQRKGGRWIGIGAVSRVDDSVIEDGLTRGARDERWHMEIIRQASGQDL